MQVFNSKRKIARTNETVKICKSCLKGRGIWRTDEGKAICHRCAKKAKRLLRILILFERLS